MTARAAATLHRFLILPGVAVAEGSPNTLSGALSAEVRPGIAPGKQNSKEDNPDPPASLGLTRYGLTALFPDSRLRVQWSYTA
jgi:hypothetical protein